MNFICASTSTEEGAIEKGVAIFSVKSKQATIPLEISALCDFITQEYDVLITTAFGQYVCYILKSADS